MQCSKVPLQADKAAFNKIVYRGDYRDDRKLLRLPRGLGGRGATGAHLDFGVAPDLDFDYFVDLSGRSLFYFDHAVRAGLDMEIDAPEAHAYSVRRLGRIYMAFLVGSTMVRQAIKTTEAAQLSAPFH